MAFEPMLEKQKQHILARFQQVYHLPLDRAEQSRFFEAARFTSCRSILTPICGGMNAEENFQRLQNEIEYGAWNRNELGEIAE